MHKRQMYKRGFGTIDMLLSLVIIAGVLVFVMPSLKGVGGGNLRDSSINYESVQEQANEKINEIEQIRQQTLKYNQNFSAEEY